MNNLQQKYSSLLKRIAAVRNKEKLVSLLSGLINFISVGLGAILLFVLLEYMFGFKSGGRIALDLILISMLTVAAAFWIGIPGWSILFRKNHPSDTAIAHKIGDHFPAIGDKLVNTIQVFPLRFNNVHGYSTDLMDQALLEIDEQVREINFEKSVSTRPVKKAGKLVGFVGMAYLLVVMFFAQNFYQAGYRLLHPNMEFTKAPDFQISVAPGNVQKLKNESIEITARVSGRMPEKINLNLKEVNTDAEFSHTVYPDKENLFKYKIEHLQDSTEYYFSVENVTTPKYLISVIELPLVRYLQVKVTPPNYSRISPKFLEENVGDINCLKGSLVEINLHSNKNLATAKLIFNNQKETELELTANRAKGAFKAVADGSYHIELVDATNFQSKDPIEYRIALIEDISPTIAIPVPGRDVDLTEDMRLPLAIEADDDFGFSSLRLAFQVFRAESPFVDTSIHHLSLSFPPEVKEKLVVDYTWDLSSLNLFAGDVVRYHAEVFDNDQVSGPKLGRSSVYSVRFPSLEEIYAEVNREQAETYDSFESVYEKSKDLQEHVDKLLQEMKQNPEVKWEQKQQIQEIFEKQKQIENTMQDIQQQLDQMVDRMEKNDLLSLETLEKYLELQKLMNELLTEEMKAALNKLHEAVQKIDSEQLQQALEQLQLSQEEFLKNIEKSLNLLKRLHIEQKLDELAKKTEELLQQQTNLNAEMKASISPEQQAALAQKQGAIKDQSAAVLSDLNQLRQTMNEFADMPADKIDQAIQQMSQEEMLMRMNQAQANLQSGKLASARSSGQMAQSSLANLSSLLNSAKSDLLAAQKQQVMNELKALSHNLLLLSKQQEELINQARRLGYNSPQINEVANRQQELASALSRTANRMGQLAEKTFFVTPQLGRAVGQSMQQMQQALSQLEQRNPSQAARSQQQAMNSLDRAIMEMLSSMNKLAGSSSAMGLEELMQQLSQMAGQQQGINQQTMQLGMGQLSLEQQAALARLAAEQAALQKSLEQLQREFGQRSEILGRLDQLGREMEEVVKDLQQKKVSPRTIERQQQILQRLLDAQKSMRKEDYSRRRKAETAKTYYARDPGSLPQDLGEKSLQMQRDLLKALKEGYSRDYQELIKKYFDALMKESIDDATKN
ncbi:MAG: hypothetical protein ONB27_09740 [candidate division KSB1 bacterium]|nr:hypothetical protein [candidate division KSB1 bacterium]